MQKQKFTFYEWRKKSNREILFCKEGKKHTFLSLFYFPLSHTLTPMWQKHLIPPLSHSVEEMDSKLVQNWGLNSEAGLTMSCRENVPLYLPTYHSIFLTHMCPSFISGPHLPSSFFFKWSIPWPTDDRQIYLLTGPISTAFHGAFVLEQSPSSNNWTSNWNICEVQQVYNVNQTSGTHPQSIWTLPCGTASMVLDLDSFFFFKGKVPTDTYPSLQPLAL